MEDLYTWMKYNALSSTTSVGTGNYNWNKYEAVSSTVSTGNYNWNKYNTVTSQVGTGSYYWDKYYTTTGTVGTGSYTWSKYHTTTSNVGTGIYTWNKYNSIYKNTYNYRSDVVSRAVTGTYNVGYTGFTFDSNTGKFTLTGTQQSYDTSDTSKYGLVLYSFSDSTKLAVQRTGKGNVYVNIYSSYLASRAYVKGSFIGTVTGTSTQYTNNTRNNDGYWYERGSEKTNTTYSRGSLITTVTGSYSAYTNNARNSDGYWYVRGSEQTNTSYIRGSYIGTVSGSQYAYTNNARNSDGYWYVRGSEQKTASYSKGTFVGTVSGSQYAYTNNARNSDGYWYVRGTEEMTTEYSKGNFLGSIMGGYSNYTDNARNSDGYWYVRGAEETVLETTYIKGPFVGTVVATYSAYTNDARNDDGYWYVRDRLNNDPPSITLVIKDNILLSEGDVLEFSGTVTDPDSGDKLSIYYKIDDNEKNTIATDVLSDQTYGKQLIFSDCKLYDGKILIIDTLNYSSTYSISVWVEDRYGVSSDVKTAHFTINGFYPSIKLFDPIDYYAAKLLMYLREQTNLFREKNGLSVVKWTVPELIPNVTSIKAIDWNEIKVAILEVYSKKGWSIKNDIVERTLNEIIIANNKNYQIVDLPIKVDMIIRGLQNK